MNEGINKRRPGPSDEALMADYQAGDLSAFDLLYTRYESQIYNYLLRLTRDPETAADLFQETFLRLHRSRKQYDSGRPFSTWLFTLASNLAKTEFARRSRAGVQRGVDVDQLSVSKPTSVEKNEIIRLVQNALEELLPEQKQVLLLSKFEGFNYREIADMTGKTVDAVKQMAYRALQSLRVKLKDI